MQEFVISPGRSAGAIRLGSKRGAIGSELGNCDTFMRTPNSVGPTDYFVSSGVLLTYDESDALVLIEIATPARAVLDGVSLLGRAHEEVAAELASLGILGHIESSGYSFSDYGVSLFVGSTKEFGIPVECVGVYAIE